MTLNDLRKKWPGFTFEASGHMASSSIWIDMWDNPDHHDPVLSGDIEKTTQEACISIDRWMTKHIKRPKSRKAAEGAKKGGAG